LNRGKRFCRPLRNHSATWPYVVDIKEKPVVPQASKPQMLPDLLPSSLLVFREATFGSLHRGVKFRRCLALHRVGNVRIQV
jgi:hypothetical protein